ncbi:MAG: HlyD family efflux transporter periplasmic adaptor subunit, partial [bacterium]
MSRTKKTILWVAVGLAVVFIVFALVNSSPRPAAAEPVDAAGTPARVYGRVEPAGGEVFVSPPLTREVVAVRVREGDGVEVGQALCVLENSVESAALAAAEARAAAAERAWALSRDGYERTFGLQAAGGSSDFELTQLRLRQELDSVNLVAARREAGSARARLDQLTLRAPVPGRVYKFDVRLGQSLAAGDNTSIILGAEGRQVRLYVESYWLDRVAVGSRFRLRDAESLEEVGRATVTHRAPYLGTRRIRTEDNRVRLDVEVQEVIASVETDR